MKIKPSFPSFLFCIALNLHYLCSTDKLHTAIGGLACIEIGGIII